MVSVMSLIIATTVSPPIGFTASDVGPHEGSTMRLEGRVAVVTGGARGIGRAYTERFLREGASVQIADVDDANANTAMADLGELGDVVGLTKFSAAQLGRWNITVNCIAPGVVATEATLNVVPEPILESLAEQQAIPGVLHADDLTGSAVFFASEESRFVTGQVLVVDGGKYMPA
jgi:NAD(P)-dependent dehydrogenase (short-subunit alcohol dehydrogenase family)